MAKKIINPGADYVEEAIQGFLLSNWRHYERGEDPEEKIIIYKQRKRDTVALLIGGGSGHEPIYTYLLGPGMGDASCAGNIFASPNPQLIYHAAQQINNGRGVLMVYGNYAGDNLNFDMAEELCEFEDIPTAHIRVMDDISIKNPEDRRGIAGLLFYVHMAGALCGSGLPLEEIVEIMKKVQSNIASLGVALSSCTLPGQTRPIFDLGEDEMEYGMGLHGEEGIERTKFATAHEIVQRIYDELQKHGNYQAGEEIALLINGLGSTTLMELETVCKEVTTMLNTDGVKIVDTRVGTWGTSQEMAGFSISFFRLDEELKRYYKMPYSSPYFFREELTDL